MNRRIKYAKHNIMKTATECYFSIQNNSQIILFYLAIETLIIFKSINNAFC